MVKKILFVLTSAELGGAERVALDAIRSLSSDKYSCAVFLPRRGSIEKELQRLRVPYEILEFGVTLRRVSKTNSWKISKTIGVGSDILRYLLKFIKLVYAIKPDIIYTHGFKAEILTAIANLWLRRKIVWHLHSFPFPGPIAPVYWFLASRVTLIIANSNAVKMTLPAKIQAKAQTIYAGVDVNQFRPFPKVEAFKTLPSVVLDAKMDTGTINIGMICVLAPWKGVDLFLKAVAPLLAAEKKLRVLIVGSAIYDTEGHARYVDELKSLIQNLKVKEQVFFIPFQENPAPAFSLLDVFVHASLSPEPFGRALTEAMSCEIPVIASAGGGVLEQVENGKQGLLFRINDVDALRNAIRELVEDKNLRRQMGFAGREFVTKNLSINQFTKSLTKAFDRC